MDNRDRKRIFSNAFCPSNDLYRKALRTAGVSSAGSGSFCTPTALFGSNMERTDPFLDNDTDMETDDGPQPCAPSRLGSDFPDGYPAIGQLPSPPSRSEINLSLGLHDVSRSSSRSGPVIFRNSDTTVHSTHEGKVGSTNLCFQRLSLHDVPETQCPRPSQPSLAATHTSMFLFESHSLQHHFPTLDANDILVSFDKGSKILKLNKYRLRHASPFFANLLDGPPCLAGYMRCMRLRGDFPHAITAMAQFLEHGVYTFSPAMRFEHPNLTLLDLHVHAYVVGAKYTVPRLCRYAINEYVAIGRTVLGTSLFGVASGESRRVGAVAPVLNSFLDSLVLVWRNTRYRDDALRQAVLELLKPKIHALLRVPFFQTLMLELVEFGGDVVGSLAEDGFDVQVADAMGGLQDRGGVRFGG